MHLKIWFNKIYLFCVLSIKIFVHQGKPFPGDGWLAREKLYRVISVITLKPSSSLEAVYDIYLGKINNAPHQSTKLKRRLSQATELNGMQVVWVLEFPVTVTMFMWCTHTKKQLLFHSLLLSLRWISSFSPQICYSVQQPTNCKWDILLNSLPWQYAISNDNTKDFTSNNRL